MEKNFYIDLKNKNSKLALRFLTEAFPDFMDEEIVYFTYVGKSDHVKSLFVLTQNYFYMYDSSNGLNLLNDVVFAIPNSMIRALGTANLMLSECVYAALLDGTVIPFKIYEEEEKIKSDFVKMNSILGSNIIHSEMKENIVRGTNMQLAKPILKRDEYMNDYLSPYHFEEKENLLKQYEEKVSSTVKKVKKSKNFGRETIAYSFKTENALVRDVLGR